MFGFFSTFALSTAIMLGASDAPAASANIPSLNIEPGCRAASKIGDSLDARFKQCVSDEQAARKELEQKWSTFSQRFKPTCIATAQIGADSYIQLLECLQLAQEADAMQKSPTTGSGQ